MVLNVLIYSSAALFEISGCYAFWMYIRLGKSPLWIIPGCCALGAFAYLLTRSSAAQAGRSFAAYGGVYIVASLLWIWVAEGVRPNRWDVAGAATCLVGAAIILHRSRGAA